MNQEKSCGAVVFTRRNGQILFVVVQERSGSYSFPKGHMEGNETEVQTACREIFEETGLRPVLVEGFRQTDEYDLSEKPGTRKQVVYFLAEFGDEPLTPMPGEIRSICLLPYDQAIQIFRFESNKRILTSAYQYLTAPRRGSRENGSVKKKEQLLFCPAHELRDMLSAGETTSAELTRFCLDRIDSFGGKNRLNAIAETDPTAMAQALQADKDLTKGCLTGLPILVKDNIDVKGLHTAAGSLALTDRIADRDAPVIAALRQAGAVILGKTNMTEFANFTSQGMPNGFSSRGGQVKHPYDPNRDPSGSSTGSAVAVAAGLCAAAIGTDTSFSVVGCATEHGICGFKPAIGSLSQEGILPISHTLDSAGILARDIRDVMLIYSAMRPEKLPEIKPLKPEKMRLAINTANRDKTSEAQLDRYAALLRRLNSAGVKTENICQMPTPMLMIVMTCEFRPDLERFLASAGYERQALAEIIRFYREDPARMPYGISRLTDAIKAAQDPALYKEALTERERLREQVLSELKSFDACLVTGPTNICHFVGIPSLSLPIGMGEDGCPRSVILYGTDEKKLLSAALTIETFAGKIQPPVMQFNQ